MSSFMMKACLFCRSRNLMFGWIMFSVINAVAKSKLVGKARIAVQVQRRMKQVSIRPITITFNNIMNACAFSDPHDDDRVEILEIALKALKEAQETCGANFITYGTCLRVIGNFEFDTSNRWRLTRTIVRECCSDGQLTKVVMNQARYSLHPAQYELLLTEVTDQRTGKLREEYTMNARRKTVAPVKKKSVS